MISQSEAQSRVAKGAAHLDTVRPGWFNQIDTGTLTLSSACRCIIGQLAKVAGGVRWAAITPLTRDLEAATDHGFYCYGGAPEYDLVQDAWIAAIADRRLATAVPDPEPVMVLHR